ncbi:hypothetical protein ACOACQ_00505 [Nocardioides sp. CPCC 206347]|uniref:hypothetical protein n=1 Tax=unclassified Nocardioides TaxID=2615069 RepID=UPI003610D6D7
MVVVAGAVLGVVALSLMILTGIGEHRRGAGAPLVVLAGAFFPIAWVGWYLKDDLPGRRQAPRVA